MKIGSAMIQAGIIKAVKPDVTTFEPNEFYRFMKHWTEETPVTEERETWHKKFETGKLVAFDQMSDAFRGKSDVFEKNRNHLSEMLMDEHNCDLFDAVRPITWVDPKVDGENVYDMLVIGGGAGGLVTASGCKSLGARVCLIERGFLGGDCLNTGCVPSKAFLKSCNVA
jgi:hypothetical protein